ncbi:hypothetical protein DSO57_1013316 [Entomophthora muscae]|uniref:Uncharacterized protein n=2 Tax=Entomophthora muscae TaxID=34485 RepID=A0ACC2UGJ0_9FUNG|nr:hypothetical protein DSO57_1013316 [Entomophthora muscae]
MKLSLLAVALPLIAECVKFRLDVSRHRGYGAPTFLNRRPNRICFRRVKKSNNTSSSQQPKYDNAAPKEKGPYNESPETDVSPDINQMPKYGASDDKKNEQPKDSDHSNQTPQYEETTQTNSPKEETPAYPGTTNKDTYDDGNKGKFNFDSPAPPPGGCVATPAQNGTDTKLKPADPDKNYDVKGMDVWLMLKMVNHARGKKPLRLNDKLMMAAKKHAEYLASQTEMFLDHAGPSGSMPWDRCKAEGYLPNLCAENIAVDYSEEKVMDAWLKSCGHYNNIMDMGNQEIGIWRTGDKWVQVFGKGESDDPSQAIPDTLNPLQHNPAKGYAPKYGYSPANTMNPLQQSPATGYAPNYGYSSANTMNPMQSNNVYSSANTMNSMQSNNVYQ